MSVKTIIIAVALCALALGITALFFMNAKPPSIQEIKANPALFKLDDYPDKIDLHTRLSTMFPRGTAMSEVESFMNAVNLAQTDTTYFECTQKNDHSNLSFIYKFPQKTLERIQVDGWPQYNEYCKPELTPVPENEEPIVVPLMPIPGVE